MNCFVSFFHLDCVYILFFWFEEIFMQEDKYSVMDLYTITNQSASYIDPSGSVFYETLCVRNITNKIVYMMRPNGQVITLHPLNAGALSIYDDGVEIQSLQREGLQTDVDDIPYLDLSRKTSHPLLNVKVSAASLERSAVYVKELGIAFAYSHLKHLLPKVHRLGDIYTRDAIIHAQEKFIAKGATVPFIISANSHDESISFYYVVINEVLTSIQVTHDKTRPEGVIATFNLGTSSSKWTIPIDMTDPVSTVCEFGTKWIMGRDRDEVLKVLTSVKNKNLDKISKEEYEQKLTEATKSLSEQLAHALREKEQLQQQLLLLKKDLDNTAQELRQANDPVNQSTEQFLARQKTLTAQYTRDITMAKLNDDRERSEAEFIRKERFADATHKRDMELADLKVQKETASTQSAQMSTTGAALKTAAVIAPIIGSLGYFFYSAVSGSVSGGVVGAACGLASACAKKIFTPSSPSSMTISPSLKEAASAVLRSLSSVTSKVTSFITDTVEAVASAVGRVFDWLTS